MSNNDYRATMRNLFVKKVNNAVNDLIKESKECFISGIEYNYNPDIVIGSVQTAYANNTIDKDTYEKFINILEQIKNIRNCKNEPVYVIQDKFKQLDNIIK